MKAIVLLFTKTSRKDSEEFLCPNITEVKVTIEGVPNQVYSQGITKSRFYDEAKRLLGSKDERDLFTTPQKFYKDKFALVVDLRSDEEVEKTEHGKKIVNTQNSILLEIKDCPYRKHLLQYLCSIRWPRQFSKQRFTKHPILIILYCIDENTFQYDYLWND